MCHCSFPLMSALLFGLSVVSLLKTLIEVLWMMSFIWVLSVVIPSRLRMTSGTCRGRTFEQLATMKYTFHKYIRIQIIPCIRPKMGQRLDTISTLLRKPIVHFSSTHSPTFQKKRLREFNARYWKKRLLKPLSNHPKVFHLAGHEHLFEYFDRHCFVSRLMI